MGHFEAELFGDLAASKVLEGVMSSGTREKDNTRDERRRAAVHTARHAKDRADLAELLAMLGIKREWVE